MNTAFTIANFISLALIFVANFAVIWFFWRLLSQQRSELATLEATPAKSTDLPRTGQLGQSKVELSQKVDLHTDLLASHVLWTFAWIAWFFGWFIYFKTKGLVSVDILDNCGAACFLGFSAILAVGRRHMLGFGWGIGGLLLAVILYLFVGPALGLNSDPALSIMNKTLADVQDVVNERLALFGPSLCLAISSLVLVAWTFLRKFKETSWSVAFAILALVYAVFQVGIFQSFFFNPGLQHDRLWKVSFLSCRLGLVWMYTAGILIAAGIRVRAKSVVWSIGALGPLVISLADFLLKRAH